MSFTISTLLTRNLDDVFGENDHARRRAVIDEIFTDDCVFYEPNGVYRGRDEAIASPARSRRRTLTFDISPLPRPRNWAMPSEFDARSIVATLRWHLLNQLDAIAFRHSAAALRLL